MNDLTTLIRSAQRGEDGAVGRLFELLYDELHRIAHAKIRNANGITLLDTTGLVHESYLKLVKMGQLQVADRPHFLAYAARAMRSIVVDFARRMLAERRGGNALHVTLDTAAGGSVTDDEQIVRVHDALAELAAIDERLVKVVEMRYFAGLDESEIAQALGVTVRTVERDWEKARLYLFASLK